MLEESMDDLHAVIDAVCSERPAILGISEGRPMSGLFGASHPDRVAALVLYGTLGADAQGAGLSLRDRPQTPGRVDQHDHGET